MTFYVPPGAMACNHGMASEHDYYSAGVASGNGSSTAQPGDWAYLNSVQLEGSFTDPNFNHAVACAVFDPFEEQIWTINRGGHLGAYYGPALTKYIGAPVQPELRQIVVTGAQHQADAGLFVLATDALHFYSKFGLHKEKFCNAQMIQLECMHYSSAQRHVFLGGQQRELQLFDARVGRQLRTADCPSGSCVILRESQKAMVGGASSGRVSFYDKHSLREHMHFDAHSLMVSDLDIQDNLLVTCGWSSRRDGLMYPDRVLRCFDLRSRQAIAPLSVVIDPAFVRFVPGFHDRLLVVSQLGDFLFIDFGNKLPASPFYKVDLPILNNGQFARITDVDVSSSARSLVFGDDSGLVHLYTLDAADHVVFNRHSVRTDIPDNLYCVNPNPTRIDSPTFYMTSLPFAYPKEQVAGDKLLSDWPDHLCTSHYRRSKPFNESLYEVVRGNTSSNASGPGGAAVVFRRPSGYGPAQNFPYLSEVELCGAYQEELNIEARQYRPKSSPALLPRVVDAKSSTPTTTSSSHLSESAPPAEVVEVEQEEASTTNDEQQVQNTSDSPIAFVTAEELDDSQPPLNTDPPAPSSEIVACVPTTS